ncbi:metallohydrolase [Agrobacterium cavarae]|uniref:Metallohydrolase n=1 Tax=Agrobacterium cavarae TaxID=2528239 RepID=A0ABY1YAA5_9HYPH|nr:metallohydrolase [Agrobacterium cavarae]TBN14871.1 metallohydrolase [Agrobacterium cavarae]
MAASSVHFKVSNGDMTLLQTGDGHYIVVDINIRAAADDPDDGAPDVAKQLKERLSRDDEGRLYVDAFLLTHPDADHCRGLEKHFHLGPLDQWKKADDKIVIREMWSSPIIFRRASRNHSLCADAKAWAAEARRRVREFRANGYAYDGNRIKILGEDINGKTDDLTEVLVVGGDVFQTIRGVTDNTFSAHLLAPLLADDDEEADFLSKNNSSVVINISLGKTDLQNPSFYLLGGDAEVGIWEKLWGKYGDDPTQFQYDVLIAPHHCSWHSLSWDSWSDFGEDAEVSEDARSALGQPMPGALIIASSKEIKDDDSDPPCIRAEREYRSILKPVNGKFTCLGEHVGDAPLEFEITSSGGPKQKDRKVTSNLTAPVILGLAGAAAGSSSALGAQPFKHG